MGFHFLNIPKTVKLKNGFKAGGIVVFRSTTLGLHPAPSGNDNTSINIMRGDNILLHISIRRKENAFVFKSKPAGYDHGDRLQVLIDYNIVIYYKKRIVGSSDGFSYNVDATTSPFSDPLIMNVYTSLAGIIPSGEVGADEGEDDAVLDENQREGA